MGTWQQELEFMHRVADAYPPIAGQAIVMYRRGKRARGRLRPATIESMRVAAADAVRMGEHVPPDGDGRRRLAPGQVYDMRIRALRLERDAALAAEYGVGQSTATRAIDGDTYRDVPFPIAITVPDLPPAWMFYPYQTAIITVQPSAPRLGMPGILRLLDQALPR
jgi:hypothetical protein